MSYNNNNDRIAVARSFIPYHSSRAAGEDAKVEDEEEEEEEGESTANFRSPRMRGAGQSVDVVGPPLIQEQMTTFLYSRRENYFLNKSPSDLYYTAI